jgi:phage regulator Rha-like protein
MISKNELKEMREIFSMLGMEISDEEIKVCYEQFVEDFNEMKKEMLMSDVCLN